MGFELEALCGRLSPQPKSRCNRDHGNSGGEGGILTLSRWASYHVFSNLHENPMNIGDFYGLSFFNSFNCSA